MVQIKESFSDRVLLIINTILLTLIFLVVLYPLVYVVSASLSNPDMVNQGKVILWPRGIHFEGYVRVFQDERIWTGFRNSIFYTAVGTLLNLVVTLPAAYSLSRNDFYGRRFFNILFTITMFFNGGMIPLYLLVKGLGMRDTIWPILILGATGMWNIVLCRTFFQTNIPDSLSEAAEIDGCGNAGIFFRIVLPLSAPIIAVMALFFGVAHWNDYFKSLIYLGNKDLHPLQLILRDILINDQLSLALVTAGDEVEALAKQARNAAIIKYAVIVVSTVPAMVAYPFVQKYFVKGVMVGAIKG